MSIAELLEEIVAMTDDGYCGGVRIQRLPSVGYLATASWMDVGVKVEQASDMTIEYTLQRLHTQLVERRVAANT